MEQNVQINNLLIDSDIYSYRTKRTRLFINGINFASKYETGSFEMKGGDDTVAEADSIPDEFGDLLNNMFLNSVPLEKPPKEEEPPMWFFDESAPYADWLFEDE